MLVGFTGPLADMAASELVAKHEFLALETITRLTAAMAGGSGVIPIIR